jgi:hypothetical protein
MQIRLLRSPRQCKRDQEYDIKINKKGLGATHIIPHKSNIGIIMTIFPTNKST